MLSFLSFLRFWLRSVLITFFLFLPLSVCYAGDLISTLTPSTGYQPQFQVFGNKSYYVWHEYDGPFRQIFTAEMDINRTGWKAERRTSGQFDKVFPQLHASGNKIYYVWQQPDATKNRQIWTAEMNVDGTGWKEVQRTNTPFDKQFPQLQAVGDKIYYAWNESDGKYRQIWTAMAEKDGTEWKSEKRTRSPYGKYDPQFQIAGDIDIIYYVWHEDHGPTEPIWVAVENLSKRGPSGCRKFGRTA
jgi:hypothetical protein